MPDRAEEYHAGHLAEQLEERDHQADGAHHVQPGDQPHLDGRHAALLVPELPVAAVRVQPTAVSFLLYATGVGHAALLRPRVDVEPVRVVLHAAAVELKTVQRDLDAFQTETREPASPTAETSTRVGEVSFAIDASRGVRSDSLPRFDFNCSFESWGRDEDFEFEFDRAKWKLRKLG